MEQPRVEAMTTEELFRRHSVFVAKYLRRLGVKDDAIDDAVQEVFLVVHKNGGYAPGAAKPTTYLVKIAIHAAASYRRRTRLATVRAAGGDVEQMASSTGDSVQSLETSERLRALQEALSRLDVSLQQTLVLADGEGESCVAIASMMGVPLGTVYWRLSRARKKFQQALRSVQAAGAVGHARPGAVAAAPRARAWSLAAVFGFESWRSPPDLALLRSVGADQPAGYDVEGGLQRFRELVRADTPAPGWMPTARVPPGLGASVGAPVALGAGFASVALVLLVVLPRWSKSPGDPHDQQAVRETARSDSMAHSAVLAARADEVEMAPVPPRAAPGTTPLTVAITETPEGSAETRIPLRGAARSRRRRLQSSESRAGSTPEAHPVDETSALEGAEHPPEAVTPTAVPSTTAPEDTAPEQRSPIGLAEASEIGRAERMLATNPAQALSIVSALRGVTGPTYLLEERDYIEVLALHLIGRGAQARQRAHAFLGSYPRSGFAKDVRMVLEGE